MNRLRLVMRVRSLTRDFSGSIFREADIIDYLNEGINRIKQVIPHLSGMTLLLERESLPILLPEQYHHVLSIYSASRCFGQDERHYQASTFMNEFEVKLDELSSNIDNGIVTIYDTDGVAIVDTNKNDYVVDKYFTKVYTDDEVVG